MKRCPQCEFIYEDDQSCCDMDGIDLVVDHATPPVTQPKTSRPGKRKTSKRPFLLVCAVVFGVLVLAIGYASLERAMTVSSEPASLVVTSAAKPATQGDDIQPQVEPARVEPAEEKPTADAEADKSVGAEPGSRNAVSPKAIEPLSRNSLGTRGVVLGSIPPQNKVEASRPQPNVIKVQPAHADAKKDSKVVSIVKKTGRLLKKPFKL